MFYSETYVLTTRPMVHRDRQGFVQL